MDESSSQEMPKSRAPAKHVLRTCALLSIVSFSLVIEGTTRVNSIASTPSGKWFSSYKDFIPFLEILAWLVLLLMGLGGLLISLSVLLFNAGHPKATLVLLVIQTLGWYTLIIELFFADEGSYGQSRSGLTGTQSNTLDAMSVISGAAYCTAQQGGAFLFSLQLYKLQDGKGREKGGALRGRLCFYSLLVVLVGACEIVMGSILQHALGTGRYPQPVVAGWLVSYHAWTNLLVGVYLTLWGSWGITKALGFVKRGESGRSWGFVAMGLVAFLLEISVHDISNVGLGTEPIQVLGTQLVGVMFCLCFLPIYTSVALDKYEEWESESLEESESKEHALRVLVSDPV